MHFKRFLCSATANRRRHPHRPQPAVKQVAKSNFSEALSDIKARITDSDFIAVSLQKTGGHSAPWQRTIPIDTAETAYLKSKRAADRFQILQFSVCPFSVRDSKLITHPYNFHLFPRDELKIGMPSYSFSFQSSYLTSMAGEGFDFNACIINGISYLSRAQESAARARFGHLSKVSNPGEPLSAHSVADSLFTQRIQSRVKSWIKTCKNSNKTEDALISALRKIVSGSEVYGDRPSLTIDICSERQVQLALDAMKEFSDVVPLRQQAPVKGGSVQVVRAVLTSSEEDKNLLEKEIESKEQEQRLQVLGFREVIELISASEKPVVAHNSLNDFTFIHSKFLAPLPPTMDEFTTTLHSVFPYIIDLNHLMKEIGAFEKMNNISGAISYLESRFSAPITMEISNREDAGEVDVYGHIVLKVCRLFLILCSILKISLEAPEGQSRQLSHSLHRYTDMLYPCSTNSTDPDADNVRISTGNSRIVTTDNIVFLWGFKGGLSARGLKDLLCDSHDVFSEHFDVRMISRTCAVVVFWTPGFSERFLRIMDSGDTFSGKFRDMISVGLRSSSYEMYRKVCESGSWKSDLAECLDQAIDETENISEAKSEDKKSVIYWNEDDTINFDDL
ncbi:Poly(A)-specific ribonuclease PARN-like [Striga hermonthica]|uniref:Poly(A)-specific ribonuclease PARN-like n=1 Tax=Striga hermonthica TaxID=68872 RepID=A0A9N7P2V4_STRHE|nr:Poly(A)-specific ribonuclease PARN-like [Striga hermonthica]